MSQDMFHTMGNYILQDHQTKAMLEAAKLGGEALLGFLECLVDDDPSLAPLIQGDFDWNRIAEALVRSQS